MAVSGLSIIVRTIKAIRGFFVAIVLLAILLPVAIFVLMSSGWANEKIKDVSEAELTHLLGTDVRIDRVKFSPFNRLDVQGISVKDDNDTTALTVREVEARFEFWDFILRQKIIIDYATIEGLSLKLYRDSLHTPINIDGIVKRLSSQETDRPSAVFNLRLNDVSLEDCDVSYDVLSEPTDESRFTPTHISVRDLSMVAFAPIVSNDEYQIRLRQLKFGEKSGFEVYNLSVNAELSQDHISLRELNFLMPRSKLSFADITVPIDSIKAIKDIASEKAVSVSLNQGSHIFLPDLKAFEPQLGDLDYTINLSFDASGTRDSVNIKSLELRDASGLLNVETHGAFTNLSHPEDIAMEGVGFSISTDTVAIAQILDKTTVKLDPKLRALLGKVGHVVAKGDAQGTINNGKFKIDLESKLAHASFVGDFMHPKHTDTYKVNGKFDVDSLMIGQLTSNPSFDGVKGKADIHGTFSKKNFLGDAKAEIEYIDFKGYRYHNINTNLSVTTESMHAALRVDDPNLSMIMLSKWQKDADNMHKIEGDIILSKLYPDTLNLVKGHPDYGLSGILHVRGQGTSLDAFEGSLNISDLSFNPRLRKQKGINLKKFELTADNLDKGGLITIESDYLNGAIEGDYRITSLVSDIKSIYETLLPALAHNPEEVDETAEPAEIEEIDGNPIEASTSNDFSIDLTLSKTEDLFDFFKIPVIPVGETHIKGHINAPEKTVIMKMDMPWIESGNNIIQRTELVVNVKADEDYGKVFLTSYIPTKKGNMDLDANLSISNGVINTNIDWTLMPEKPIGGKINFSTILSRDDEDDLITEINFNPGDINFGDEIWSIQKSLITYGHGKARITNFGLSTPTQSLNVNGVLGDGANDRLIVNLNNIQLISIFETLDIQNALIGGYATGTITADALLSKMPMISSENLTVKSIGYNYCTLGDADVKLNFDDGGKIFKFDGEVTQPEGYKSHIDGFIEIATETLDLNIKANHIKVGFMKPFMAAFTSDIEGYATGTAHLFGTFKDLDMTGDINVESVKIKIDFTNTYYYASDRVVIRPGLIDLNNITLSDEYGHKALLNGWVAHKYFHDASFEFSITEAKNLLCYDITEKMNEDWYGRIFGNGSAKIKGEPGEVNITVNMSTAANSTFTFVLSNQQDADEYSFITFRDVTPKSVPDSIIDKEIIPKRVLEKTSKTSTSVDTPTEYNMDINMTVLPQAQIYIIMDPVGGDYIHATGEGSMRMYYGSANNDLRLYGTYTLDHGSYKFTLQDIIIKDFTIKEGSSIKFTGDPYAAQLDIKAFNQVNANLADLDESFLQDKELNRTNVPVRALMQVTGDMRQPDITFDLEFPTLSEDVYRKVKSIVSTEEMMNTQIIYLLALTRFYTPEYMASTNKTNDLFSVASSTISSQISNMLGKLSENWSIAPNLRSDRGDFSDLEVDVNLTSTLLNNRLLLNGNFGYRDKSLNTNQFIGDFDLEYLLTRSGEWRLKAYNRYNDQNYYLRTAQTTQGVGIVYRRDFDRPFKFLKHIKKWFNKESADPVAPNIPAINPQIINDKDTLATDSATIVK